MPVRGRCGTDPARTEGSGRPVAVLHLLWALVNQARPVRAGGRGRSDTLAERTPSRRRTRTSPLASRSRFGSEAETTSRIWTSRRVASATSTSPGCWAAVPSPLPLLRCPLDLEEAGPTVPPIASCERNTLGCRLVITTLGQLGAGWPVSALPACSRYRDGSRIQTAARIRSARVAGRWSGIGFWLI